jgi:hypothetical protein
VRRAQKKSRPAVLGHLSHGQHKPDGYVLMQ